MNQQTEAFCQLYRTQGLEDQTLFIKEVLESEHSILTCTRPPKQGKTVTLAMLHFFFENGGNDSKSLFQDLEIGREQSPMLHQGKYPVIHLDFNIARHGSLLECQQAIQKEIVREYQRHKDLLFPTLSKDAQARYQQILQGDSTGGNLSLEKTQNALLLLSEWLYERHKNKVFLLIDNYEAPFQTAFQWKYQESLCKFYGTLLQKTLANPSFLKKAVLMGIIPFAWDQLSMGEDSLLSVLGNQMEHSSLFHSSFLHDFVPPVPMEANYPRHLQDWLKSYFYPMDDLFAQLLRGETVPYQLSSLEVNPFELSKVEEVLKLLLFYQVLTMERPEAGFPVNAEIKITGAGASPWDLCFTIPLASL